MGAREAELFDSRRHVRPVLPALAAVAALAWLAAGPAAARMLGPAPVACLAGAEAATGADAPDARTLRLADGRALRLAAVEPFGLMTEDAQGAEKAMRARLQALAAGARLTLQPLGRAPDRYGRMPAMVALGPDLAQEMLAREGLALAFAGGDPLPCFDRILAAEAAARRGKRGFWAAIALPAADPQALSGRIGRFAIFEGTVASVGNRRARTYLNFGKRWTEDVTVVIAAKDRKRFGGESALAALAGRKVRARGYLEARGGPMLTARSPMQIEILDAVEAGGAGTKGEQP